MMVGFRYKSGAGNPTVSTVISIPKRARVKVITCDSDDSSPTIIKIGDGDEICVSTSFSEDVFNLLIGPVDITFTNAKAYYVSWVE